MRDRHIGITSAAYQGFSIIELMVAMALGILILGGVVSLFASSRNSYESNEQLSRVQENGRFALDQIVRDVRDAGYRGCAKNATFTNTLINPTGLLWNFSQAVYGFESTAAGTWTPAIAPEVLSPDTSAAGRSDVLVVRVADRNSSPQRLGVKMVTTTDALTLDDANVPDHTGPAPYKPGGGEWLLISDCSASAVFESSGFGSPVLQHAAGGLNPGNSTDNLEASFDAGAEIFPVRTVIYYVRLHNLAKPAGPTSLWRIVGSNGPEELIEGVDSLQLLYGRDTNGDGLVDDYVKANAVTNWDNVISVSVGLLVRSLDEYGTDTDSAAHTVLGQVVPAYGDRRQRKIFTSTATLRNRAW